MTITFLRGAAARLALLAGAALTAMTVAGGVAGASGESVSASPNPLVLPAGQSSGSATISWNRGMYPNAELFASKNGGAEYQLTGLSGVLPSVSGSTSVSGFQTGSYAIRMYSSWKKLAVVAQTTLSVQQAPNNPGGNGMVNVATVSTDPGAFKVNFSITTSEPSKAVVEVGTSAPNANNTFSNPAGGVFTLGYAKQMTPMISNLQPATLYYYVAKITSQDGDVVYKKGTFHTDMPVVKARFGQIHMIDDSDGWPRGAGDMTFFFENGSQDFFSPEVQMESGTFRNAGSLCPSAFSSPVKSCDGTTYLWLNRYATTGTVTVTACDDDKTIFDANNPKECAGETLSYNFGGEVDATEQTHTLVLGHAGGGVYLTVNVKLFFGFVPYSNV